MSGEDLVWRLLIPLMILAQLAASALGWKRSYRFAGGAVAFSPALLYLVMLVLSVENGRPGGTFSPPASLAFLLLILVPLVIGVLHAARAGLPAYSLWLAWTLNLIPLVFLIFIECCFRLQF